MARIIFHTEESLGVRFAYSPLLELTVSYFILGRHIYRSLYGEWMEEATQAINGQSYPFMDSLILNLDKTGGTGHYNTYIPDFLTPTPNSAIADIEATFDALRATDINVIQHHVQQLIQAKGETELRCYFLAYPAEAREALISELRDYWQRALAHHWSAMVSVLENDILHRSRLLTLDGAASLLPTISENISYEQGAITFDLSKHKLEQAEVAHRQSNPGHRATVADDTLDLHTPAVRFVPVIFAGYTIFHQLSDPMIIYKPRGTGLWHTSLPDPEDALITTIGAGKARILLALATPQSTGELARNLSLTAGAVSQQLSKLNSAGLVTSHRNGKRVYYRLTARGQQLVALFVG